MARIKRDKPTFIEEARQRQILEISREIFANVGFKKASLADIADTAGISKGVILYHYGSKAELGKAVLQNTLNSYGEFLGDCLQKKKSPKDKLLEVPNACANYIRENRNPFLLYIDVLGSFGDLEEKRVFMAKTNQVQRDFLIRLVNDCKKDGLFKGVNANTIADIVQASLDGLMEQYSVDPDAIDLMACARLLKKFLENSM